MTRAEALQRAASLNTAIKEKKSRMRDLKAEIQQDCRARDGLLAQAGINVNTQPRRHRAHNHQDGTSS